MQVEDNIDSKDVCLCTRKNVFILIENCFYSDNAIYNRFLEPRSANHAYCFAHCETNEN